MDNDGYVNHCPRCLWSRHVDVDPGDRAEDCRGMMRPTQVLLEGDRYVLVHRCEACGLVRRNRADRRDDPAALAERFAPADGDPLAVPPRRPGAGPRTGRA